MLYVEGEISRNKNMPSLQEYYCLVRKTEFIILIIIENYHDKHYKSKAL